LRLVRAASGFDRLCASLTKSSAVLPTAPVGSRVISQIDSTLDKRSVSHASLSDTSPALYSEVAFASLIGAATTAHRPSLHALAGIVLIAAAGALAWAQPGEKT
jgi:hypothetical protein